MRFAEFLRECNVAVAPAGHHHSRDGWVQFDCAWCGAIGRGKYHMGYNIQYSYCHCWKCGRHGLNDTVMLLTGLSAGATIAALRDVPRERAVARVHTGTLKIPPHVEDMQWAHRQYLVGRNFDPEYIERVWGVRGIGPCGTLKWRLWVPIHFRGELVSWTTRAIGEEIGQRYLSADETQESYPRKNTLYGADYCRHACIIHEGPVDVWRTGPGAVATMGTSYSRAQLLEMSNFLIRAVCFDNEPLAQRRARALAAALAPFPGETLLVTLDAKDTAEETEYNIQRLRTEILGIAL